jgi:hypothetical protein
VDRKGNVLVKFKLGCWGAFALLGFGLVSCSKKSEPPATTTPGAELRVGRYVPDTAVVGSPTLKGTVTVTETILNYSNVGMVRFDDPWGSKELLVDLGTFSSSADFGPNGSITLVAETLNYPLAQGGAYPVLTSFYVDTGSGTTEFVKLNGTCATSGMWNCSSGFCQANACSVATGSSFGGRSDWDQHQIPPYGYPTTNAFPRCDGSLNSWSFNGSACPVSGALPSGHYYAKYVLMSDSGNSVASLLANLRITMSVKKDTAARNTGTVYGGININLILVGDQNIQDSLTTRGARNLDLLFKEVNRLLKEASGANIAINELKVFEWADADGGSRYSQVDYLDLGSLFETGSKATLLGPGSGNAVNIFLVSDIIYGGNTSFRILGVSGGILGPPINGTQTSGLAFSSGDELASLNLKCTVSNCDRKHQENDFLEMAATITHELGHFLGLNHPSESGDPSEQSHDALSDTPVCASRGSGQSAKLDQRACYFTDTTSQPAPLAGMTCKAACDAFTSTPRYMTASAVAANIDLNPSVQTGSYSGNPDMPGKFCPDVVQCQFNHIMWYTTKNRQLNASGTWNEDGNMFSPQSSAVLQWSPLVR